MKNKLLFFFSTLCFSSVLAQKNIQVDTLFTDKISIRALKIDDDKVWYAADKSRVGFVDLQSKSRKEFKLNQQNENLEFRSIAQTKKNIFVLSVASPAYLYQIDKTNFESKLVYQNNHKDVFFDSMQFLNDNDGIAFGDPIDGKWCVIQTKDGGKNWVSNLNFDFFPAQGESAFAASNTNIISKENHIWIVTGGKKSRILHSANKGKKWNITETPIISGKTMTGIFTADFFDTKKGIIAGGDYETPEQNFSNKAITTDGGNTWKLISDKESFGYTSCIQFSPDGKKLVSAGASGIFISENQGNSWQKISSDTKIFTFRFVNNDTIIAAGANKIIRIKF